MKPGRPQTRIPRAQRASYERLGMTPALFRRRVELAMVIYRTTWRELMAAAGCGLLGGWLRSGFRLHVRECDKLLRYFSVSREVWCGPESVLIPHLQRSKFLLDQQAEGPVPHEYVAELTRKEGLFG